MSDSVWSRALENQELFKKLYKQNESGAEREYQGTPKEDSIDTLTSLFQGLDSKNEKQLNHILTNDYGSPTKLSVPYEQLDSAKRQDLKQELVSRIKYEKVAAMCMGLTGDAEQACLVKQSQAFDALDSEYYPGD